MAAPIPETSLYPVYFVLDTSLPPAKYEQLLTDPALLTNLGEYQANEHDILVLSRDEIEGGSKKKKKDAPKRAKGESKGEPEEDPHVTVTENMLENLKDLIAKEVEDRQQAIVAQRQAEADAEEAKRLAIENSIANRRNERKGGRNTRKGGKKSARSKKSGKSPRGSARGKSKANIGTEKREEKEDEEEIEPYKPPKPKHYPERAALLVILHDVVRHPKDAQFMLETGEVAVHALIHFQEDPVLIPKDDIDTSEFLYGPPIQDDRPKTEAELKAMEALADERELTYLREEALKEAEAQELKRISEEEERAAQEEKEANSKKKHSGKSPRSRRGDTSARGRNPDRSQLASSSSSGGPTQDEEDDEDVIVKSLKIQFQEDLCDQKTEGFVDFVFIPIQLPELPKPDPVAEEAARLREEEAKNTKGKKKSADKKPKDSKKGRGKHANEEDEKDQEEVHTITPMETLIGDIVIGMRTFSEKQVNFEKWKKDAHVIPIPDSLPSIETVPMSLYNNLMDQVPRACSNIPLMLHCMFEQVASTVLQQNESQVFSQQASSSLESYLDSAFSDIQNNISPTAAASASNTNPLVEADNTPLNGTVSTDRMVLSRSGHRKSDGVNGGQHNFSNGYCLGCGQSEWLDENGNEVAPDHFPPNPNVASNISRANNNEASSDYCPFMIGAKCSFMNGKCVNCGLKQGNTNTLQNMTASRASTSHSKQSFNNTDRVFGPDKDTRLFCPGTMGNPHDFSDPATGGRCSVCAISRHELEGLERTDISLEERLALAATSSSIDNITDGALNKGVEEEDNNTGNICPSTMGLPCIFREGACIRCNMEQDFIRGPVGPNGGSAQQAIAADTVSEDRYITGASAEALADVDATIAQSQYCPAAIGQLHQFSDETRQCNQCGEIEAIGSDGTKFEPDNDESSLNNASTIVNNKFCPASIGEDCNFVQGMCANCGQSKQIAGSTAHLGQTPRDLTSASGTLDLNLCPASIGLPCNFVDGRCPECGQVRPAHKEPSAATIEDSIVPEASSDVPLNDTKQSTLSHQLSEPEYCPGQMGQSCEWMDGFCIHCNSEQHMVMSAQMSTNAASTFKPRSTNSANTLAGQTKPVRIRNTSVCPATLGSYISANDPKEIAEKASTTVVLNAGDDRMIKHARSCLDLGLDFDKENHPIWEEADDLVANWLLLPGVRRCGMPAPDQLSSEASRGANKTEMVNTSSIPPSTFESALISINFTEMLDKPAPDFAYTCKDPDYHFHLDHLTKGGESSLVEAAVLKRMKELQENVHLAAVALAEMREEERKRNLPVSEEDELASSLLSDMTAEQKLEAKEGKSTPRGKKSKKDTGAGRSPLSPRGGNKSDRKGKSGKMTKQQKEEAQALAEAKAAEEAARLAEEAAIIKPEPIKYDMDGKPDNPFVIDTMAAEDKSDVSRDWELGSRTYREELDAEVLQQRLYELMACPVPTMHTQARYSPMDDTLFVSSHVRTPLSRARYYDWNDFICPTFSFKEWASCSLKVQRMCPSFMYKLSRAHSGYLRDSSQVFFPTDRAQIGFNKIQCGNDHTSRLWLLKDGNFVMVEANIEDLPPKPAEYIEDPTELGRLKDEIRAERKKANPSLYQTHAPSNEEEKQTEGEEGGRPRSRKKESKAERQARLAAEVEATEAMRREELFIKKEARARRNERKRQALAAIQSWNEAAASNHVTHIQFSDKTRARFTGTQALDTMRLSFTTATGLLVEMTHDDKVYQSLPTLSQGVSGRDSILIKYNGKGTANSVATDAAASEQWRCINSDGSVIRKLLNGSTQILFANGNVSMQETEGGSWIITNNSGIRSVTGPDGTAMCLPSIQVAEEQDPETNAWVMTREDLVMYIVYADGSSLAQHADGTRIYVDKYPGDKKERISIEAPRFAPVTYIHEKKVYLSDGTTNRNNATVSAGATLGASMGTKNRLAERDAAVTSQLKSHTETRCTVSLFDGTLLERLSPVNMIHVQKPSGDRLWYFNEGKLLYVPNAISSDSLNDGIQKGIFEPSAVPKMCYTLDNVEGSILTYDDDENKFYLRTNGDCEGLLSRNRGLGGPENVIPAEYYPPPSKPIPPRLLIIRGDGTGYELHDNMEIETELKRVEANPATILLPKEVFMSSPAVEGAANVSSALKTKQTVSGTEESKLQEDQDADEDDDAKFDDDVVIPPFDDGEDSDGDVLVNDPCATEVSIKYLKPLAAPSSYVREPLVPNVVKAAINPANAGQESSTSFILYRHLLESAPLENETIQQVWQDREVFRERKEGLREQDKQLSVQVDTRPAEEVEQELQLQKEAIEARKQREARRKAERERLNEAKSSSLRDATTRAMPRLSLTSSMSSRANDGRVPTAEVQPTPRRPEIIQSYTQALGAATRTATATSQGHGLPIDAPGKRGITRNPNDVVPVSGLQVAGEREPLRFFHRKEDDLSAPKQRNQLPYNSAPRDGHQYPKSSPELVPFFQNKTFSRQFDLNQVMQNMRLMCLPPSKSHVVVDRMGLIEDPQLNADELKYYTAQVTSLVHAISTLGSCVSRILGRPQDASLRTVDLSQAPYADVVQSHPALQLHAESLINSLGFARHNNRNWVLRTNHSTLRESLNNLGSAATAMTQKVESINKKAADNDIQDNIDLEGRHSVPSPVSGSMLERKFRTRVERTGKFQVNVVNPVDSSDEEDDAIGYEEYVDKIEREKKAALARSPKTLKYQMREQRLANQPLAQHERNGNSFTYKSRFAPDKRTGPPAKVRTYVSPVNPCEFDVTGWPRKGNVTLPTAMGPSAYSEYNTGHMGRNLDARRRIKTSSTALRANVEALEFPQCTLQPSHVDFGRVQLNSTYRVTVTLTNTGMDVCRYQVQQPIPQDDSLVFVRALHRPGTLAPGMQKKIEVELYAGSEGVFEEQLIIRTPKRVFALPVLACVEREVPHQLARKRDVERRRAAASLKKGRRVASHSTNKIAAAAASDTTGQFGSVGKVRLLSREPGKLIQQFLMQRGIDINAVSNDSEMNNVQANLEVTQQRESKYDSVDAQTNPHMYNSNMNQTLEAAENVNNSRAEPDLRKFYNPRAQRQGFASQFNDDLNGVPEPALPQIARNQV